MDIRKHYDSFVSKFMAGDEQADETGVEDQHPERSETTRGLVGGWDYPLLGGIQMLIEIISNGEEYHRPQCLESPR